MPEKKPNQFARVVAVLGLIAASLAVGVTIATTSSDGGGDGDDTKKADGKGATKKGERALERGVWVVGEGDTLVSISEATGIDLDDLVALNPEVDPQTLSPGQRISLREAAGGAEGDDSGSGQETVDTITEGSGIGDEGPTGDTTETSGDFSN